jgi:hypothetical protein
MRVPGSGVSTPGGQAETAFSQDRDRADLGHPLLPSYDGTSNSAFITRLDRELRYHDPHIAK